MACRDLPRPHRVSRRLALAMFACMALVALSPTEVAAAPGAQAAKRAAPVSRSHRAWRPTWWPSWMPAGTGQPGIVVRLRHNRVYVHDGYQGWMHCPAATGKDWATPRGTYRIVSKVRYPAWHYKDQYVPGGSYSNPLGVAWLGLGMPPGWGRYPVGIHGTNAPWSIGYRVSKGCIRLRNRDVLRVYRMVPVGTPVTITL